MRPEPSSGEVTTFQPARPPLIRSREANWRATVNGSLYDVDSVPAKPILLVAVASADRIVSGSNRLRKCGMDFSVMYRPSATKAKAMPCASALRAMSTKKPRLTLASAGLEGCFQAFIWLPGPCNMMPKGMVRAGTGLGVMLIA